MCKLNHIFVPAGKRGVLPGLVLAALLLPTLAVAQPPQPSSSTPEATSPHEGNTWNGLHHQPTQNTITSSERQRGIAPPPARQRAIDRSVERIDRKLLSSPKK